MNLKILQHKTTIQFLKYSFVGGTATIIDFTLLYTLTEHLRIHYMLSAAMAVTVALTYNYALCISWVFDKRRFKNKIAELLIFLIIATTGVILNGAVIYALTEYAKFYYLISKIFSTAVVLLWNFFARKIILFR